MHTTERPVDLAAARRARALAHATTTGDRWADLHGVTRRPAPPPPAAADVIPFRPSR